MEKGFSIPTGCNVPKIDELIRQVLKDKGMSSQEFAEKLMVSVEEVEAYDDYKSAPSTEILKRMSGVLGIRYSVLRISAGYNCVGSYPDFYLPNGEEINLDNQLDRIYYKDPSILPIMFKVLFKN